MSSIKGTNHCKVSWTIGKKTKGKGQITVRSKWQMSKKQMAKRQMSKAKKSKGQMGQIRGQIRGQITVKSKRQMSISQMAKRQRDIKRTNIKLDKSL